MHFLRYGFKTDEQNGGRERKRKMVKTRRKIQTTTRKQKRIRRKRKPAEKTENLAAMWKLKRKKTTVWIWKDKKQAMKRNRKTNIARGLQRESQSKRSTQRSVGDLRDMVMFMPRKNTVRENSIILRR